MIYYPVLSQYSSTFAASKSLFFDMSNRGLGSYSSPPHPTSSIYFEFPAPPLEATLEPLQIPQAQPPPPPQVVFVESAPEEDLDATVEYYLEADHPEVASNAVVLVDATTQVSRPPSRPGSARASPHPIIGLRISGVVEAVITAAAPVYATRSPRASPPPPPPPAYADSAARVVRRPPNALLVQRPRTRSSAGDGPLFEPLISDNRCFLTLAL